MQKTRSFWASMAHAGVALGFTLFSATASAGLVINVVGVYGSGHTTWSMSGSSSASQDATVRDGDGSNNFNGGDSFETSETGNFIANTSLSNQLFEIQGDASVSIGGQTDSITHIFLDDDGIAFDDIGIRTANSLNYISGQDTEWAGTFDLQIDISNFFEGAFASAGSASGGFTGPWFSQDADVMIFVSVPETGTIALFAAGLLAFGLRRGLSS